MRKIVLAIIVMLGLSGLVRAEDWYAITSKKSYAKASEGFTRAGVKKAIITGLAAVMIAVFGLSPTSSAQVRDITTIDDMRDFAVKQGKEYGTEYKLKPDKKPLQSGKIMPLKSIDSTYVSEKKESNYVTSQEKKERVENKKLNACSSLVGRTFTVNPPMDSDYKNVYETPNIYGNSFRLRNPENFKIIKLIPTSNVSIKKFMDEPYYKGFYKIQFDSGKTGFVPLSSLRWFIADRWGNAPHEIDAWEKNALWGD